MHVLYDASPALACLPCGKRRTCSMRCHCAAGLHGVYQLPTAACPDNFAPGNGLLELVKPQNGGNYVWRPPTDAKKDNKASIGRAGIVPCFGS